MTSKIRKQICNLEKLEKIPPYGKAHLSVEHYTVIKDYLTMVRKLFCYRFMFHVATIHSSVFNFYLLYLPYVIGQTGLSTQYRPR